MLKILRLMRGYVRIRITALSPQRFMNLCTVNEIELWDIRTDGSAFEMNLLVCDFLRLRPIVRKTRTKVVLLEKRGLPFSLRKWKKRKVFLCGSLICVCGLYVISLFLWDIELKQEGRLTKDMLLTFLQDNHIGYGSYIKGIDIDSAEKNLRDTYPFILWTSFRIEGTRLYVDVKENAAEGSIAVSTDAVPSNLLSTVDGTVSSIITRTGIPQVQAGDTVKKGDVLVTGEIPVYNDDETIREYMYVCADADVWVDTTLHYQKKLPFAYQKKVYTGNVKTAFYFRLYKNSFSTAGLPGFDAYDIVTDLRQAKLLRDFYLPLYYGKIVYQEYMLTDFTYTSSEAKQILSAEFDKFYETLQEKGVQIIEKDVKIKKSGQSMTAEGTIRVRMKDGESRRLPESVRETDTEEEKNDTQVRQE